MSKFTDRRKIRKKVPVRLTTYPAVLGDDNGNITVPGRPNFVYARVGGNVEQVFNNRTPAVAGLLVVVGRDEQDPQGLGVFQVLSVRTNAPGGINGPSYGGYAPAARYRIFDPDGGQDPLYVEERQYLPLGVFPYSGQTVQIFPGSCYTGSGVTWVEWQTVDLSGFTPAGAGDACEVMITVDTTGAVVATAGADYTMNSNITADDRLAQAPAIPTSTARVIGLVRVYNGQTTIQEARNTTDIFDLRSAAISLGDSALPETIYGKNESGGSIVKGQAISITAASGQWTAFDLTDATDPGSAYAFIGLAAENAANNDFFNVAISRELSGFSTTGLVEGGAVYVNPASPGNLTASFPSAPNYIINVGICERVHANQGRIQIAKLIQPKLSELSDVTRTPPSITGQSLEWNNTTKTWGYTAAALASTYLKLDASNDPLTGALDINLSSGTPLGTNTGLRITGATGSAGVELYAYGGSAVVGQNRANGTLASPSALLSGEAIGSFIFRGYGTTGFNASAARIRAITSELFNDTSGGTGLLLTTTPNGSVSDAVRLWLSQSGNVHVGTTDPTAARFMITGASDIIQSLITMFSSQTADAFSVRNSSTTQLAGITAAGGLKVTSSIFAGPSWKRIFGVASDAIEVGENATAANTTPTSVTIDAPTGTGSGNAGSIIIRTATSTGSAATSVSHDTASAVHKTSAATQTQSVTVGANSDRILLVQIIYPSALRTSSTVTYGGVAMTLVTRLTTTVNHELWYLLAPATGANNIVITPDAATALKVGWQSKYGVSQTTPFDAVVTNSGNGTTASVTAVLAGTGRTTVDFLFKNNLTELPSANGTQTQRYIEGTSYYGGSSDKDGGTTMSWTWATTSRAWSMIALPLIPSALTVNTKTTALTIAPTVITAALPVTFQQGISLPYVAKTANYTLTDADYTVNATSGSFTLTLPTAVGRAGKVFQCNNSGTGLITVDADGTELINGDLTVTLAQWEQITVQSTGTGWILIH